MFSNEHTNTNQKLTELFDLLGEYGNSLKAQLAKLPSTENQAISFLYTISPLSDLINYSVEDILPFAQHGIWLRENVEHCKSLSDELFFQYVLHHRVNNEEIAPCRSIFYNCLKDRIVGKTVKEAIIEANYWCAENVTYQSTDTRTSSALAIYNNARGRCGEESTFTVNVLRSIGIPARQVYAPRWSHCDDNHAWVEVYSEGTWYFLGACEPDEELNRGWFVPASSRAMLVHSRYFGTPMQEEVTDKTSFAWQLNQLKKYSHTKKLTVTVKNANGTPSENSIVHFQVFNYSQLSHISSINTDSNGQCSLTTGLGSLYISVAKDNLFAYTISEPNSTEIELALSPKELNKNWLPMSFTPPKESLGRDTKLTDTQRLTATAKLASANEKRKSKVASFISPISDWLSSQPDKNELLLIAEKCLSNVLELKAFFEESESDRELKKSVLSTLPTKDLGDFKANILLEHLNYANDYKNSFDSDIFINYLLSPRISIAGSPAYEILSKFRRELLSLLTPAQQMKFKTSPKQIVAYVNEYIHSYPATDIPALCTTPIGTISSKVGSSHSKKVLAVAIARSLGVPARLNPSNMAVEFYENGSFVAAENEHQLSCTLTLLGGGIDWGYNKNWSIGIWDGDDYEALELPDEAWVNDQLTLKLESGDYRIFTSARLTDGTVWANSTELRLTSDEPITKALELRKVTAKDMLEDISLDEFTLLLGNDKISSKTITSKPTVFCWLGVGQEPSEHILNELVEDKARFEPISDQLAFVLPEQCKINDPTLQKALKALPHAKVYVDIEQKAGSPLARRMYLDPDTLPILMILDKNHVGRYGICGYNVGTVDMVSRILEILSF